MYDWVGVADDLPQIERGRENVTVDVIVKTADGKVQPAFYAYHTREWYKPSGRRIRDDVVAWRSAHG